MAKSFKLPKEYTDITDYVLDLEKELEELRAFKDSIINAELLSKKYRVVAPYSNHPIEDTIQFYYSAERFKDYNFSNSELKKLPYQHIKDLYMKNPEVYNWMGHDSNWVCTEGGEGYMERKFNLVRFNNMIQHSTIVSDFIKSDQNIKLSLIK